MIVRLNVCRLATQLKKKRIGRTFTVGTVSLPRTALDIPYKS